MPELPIEYSFTPDYSSGIIPKQVNLQQNSSVYDVGINPLSSIEDARSYNQPTALKWVNGITAGLAKITPGLIEQAGYILDFENWGIIAGNTPEDGGDNALSRAMRQIKEKIDEHIPVYQRQNDGFDPTQAGWWASSIGNLLESVTEFAILGFGTGSLLKATARGLAGGIFKAGAKKAAVKFLQGANASVQGIDAALLTHTEGVMQGVQTYEQVKREAPNFKLNINNGDLVNIKDLSPEELESGSYRSLTPQEIDTKANEASATAVKLNYANIALNYTSLGPVFRRNSSKTMTGLGAIAGENSASYLGRTAEGYNATWKNTFKDIVGFNKRKLVGEMPQEAGEELVNQWASNQGLAQAGLMSEDEASLYNTATSEQGMASMLLGAIGGAGQHTVLNKIKSKRNKEANDKTWRNQRQTIASTLGDNGAAYMMSVQKETQAREMLQRAVDSGDTDLANIATSILQNNVNARNILAGTTDQVHELIDNNIQLLQSEEGQQQLIKQGLLQSQSDEDIAKASQSFNQAKTKLNEDESIFNNYKTQAEFYSVKGDNKPVIASTLYTYDRLLDTFNKTIQTNQANINNTVNKLNNKLVSIEVQKAQNLYYGTGSDALDAPIATPLETDLEQPIQWFNENYKGTDISKIKSTPEYQELEARVNKQQDIVEAREKIKEQFEEWQNVKKTSDAINKSEQESNQRAAQREEDAKTPETLVAPIGAVVEEVAQPTGEADFSSLSDEDLKKELDTIGMKVAMGENHLSDTLDSLVKEKIRRDAPVEEEEITNGPDEINTQPDEEEELEEDENEYPEEFPVEEVMEEVPAIVDNVPPVNVHTRNDELASLIRLGTSTIVNEGLKLTSIHSIAKSDSGFEVSEFGYKNAFDGSGEKQDDGKEGWVLNTDKASFGDTLRFEIDTESKVDDTLEGEDKIVIAIYLGANKVGYVHTPQYFNSNKVVVPDGVVELGQEAVDAWYKQKEEEHRVWRSKLLKAINEGVVETTIVGKGLGFIRYRNNYVPLTSIPKTEFDTGNIVMAVWTGTEMKTYLARNTKTGNKIEIDPRYNVGKIPFGATVFLVKNAANTYVPVYAKLKQLSDENSDGTIGYVTRNIADEFVAFLEGKGFTENSFIHKYIHYDFKEPVGRFQKNNEVIVGKDTGGKFIKFAGNAKVKRPGKKWYFADVTDIDEFIKELQAVYINVRAEVLEKEKEGSKYFNDLYYSNFIGHNIDARFDTNSQEFVYTENTTVQYNPQFENQELTPEELAEIEADIIRDAYTFEAQEQEYKDTSVDMGDLVVGVEAKRKETEAKIKRKDLFDGVGEFSKKLGGSDKAAVPVSHKEKNGIEFVEYAHPETGSIDVIVTGKSDNDFVGFYRIYENGKPTNKWSSKFENQSRNKEDFKTMIGGVQEMLPKGHEYTEKTSISTDGLRVWEQQLSRGYELQYDENGKLITNLVAINGDAIVNELGIPVQKGEFENIKVKSKEDFEVVKKALLPYLEKLGLGENDVRWLTGTVKINLPVLKSTKTVEPTTSNQSKIEAKKADIERINKEWQEELGAKLSKDVYDKVINKEKLDAGEEDFWKDTIDKINTKYDAERDALDNKEVNTKDSEAALKKLMEDSGLNLDESVNVESPQGAFSAEQEAALADKTKTSLILNGLLTPTAESDIIESLQYYIATSQNGREKIEERMNYFNSVLEVVETHPDSIVKTQSIAKLENIVNNLFTALEEGNLEKLESVAKENLRQYFSKEEIAKMNDIEEDSEETDEDGNVINKEEKGQSFDEDMALRENRLSSSERVKKLLSTIQNKRYKTDGTVTGITNSMGLPSLVPATDIFNKILDITSDHYYESNSSGFEQMVQDIETYGTESDPIYKEVARLVKEADDNIQRDFFRIACSNFNNRKNTLITLSNPFTPQAGRLAKNLSDNFMQFSAKVIDSDQTSLSAQIVNRFVDDLANSEYWDFEERTVDLEGLGSLYEEAKVLAEDKTIWGTRGLNKDGQDKVGALLDKFGINVDPKAINSWLNTNSISAQAKFKTVMLGKNGMLVKFGPDAAKYEDVETESDELGYYSPFENNLSDINELAKAQSKFETGIFNHVYRHDGKNFYAYTRYNPFTQMYRMLTDVRKNESLNRKRKIFLDNAKLDPFKAQSLILQAFRGNTKADENLANSIELFTDSGFRNVSQNGDFVNYKSSVVNTYEFAKMFAFQNSGFPTANFITDTWSDSTTVTGVKMNKTNLNLKLVNGKYEIGSSTVDVLYRYFKAEHDRILQVQRLEKTGELKSKKLLIGGKIFFIFQDFNNEAYLKNEDGSFKETLTPAEQELVRAKIKEIVVKVKNDTLADWEKIGITSTIQGNLKDKPLGSQKVLRMDKKYLGSLLDILYGTPKDPAYKKDITGDVETNKALLYNNSKFGDSRLNSEREQLADIAALDYVVNYMVHTNEHLLIFGDPAQMSKKGDSVEEIIDSTLQEISKRNAKLKASGDNAYWNSPTYKTVQAQDVEVMNSYFDVAKNEFGLKKTDSTDAQELVTVEEHLEFMVAYGKIDNDKKNELWKILDTDAYNFKMKANEKAPTAEQLNTALNSKELKFTSDIQKPVQVGSVFNEKLSMFEDYYIKTSAVPLVPSLIKGNKALEDLHKDMYTQGVDRVVFESGVKIGNSTETKSIFNEDGSYNPSFISNGAVMTLSRDSFFRQQEMPYDEHKTEIREASQLAKLVFVDLPESMLYSDGSTVGSKKEEYVQLHKDLYNLKWAKFKEEAGIGNDFRIVDVKKFASALKKAAGEKSISAHTIAAIGYDEETQGFSVPLNFISDRTKIEPILLSMFNNKIARVKLPGKSYVQVSDVIFKAQGLQTLDNTTDSDKSSIVYVKPEYKELNGLKYIREEDGVIKPAQIIIPWHFKDANGNILDMKQFVKEDGTLDLEKIPEELLQITGLRIPTQGPNSSMSFEIIGFFPPNMGDRIIADSNIVLQMGSDFDVDKLYVYNRAYSVNKKEKGLTLSTITGREVSSMEKENERSVEAGEEPKHSETKINKFRELSIKDRIVKIHYDTQLLPQRYKDSLIPVDTQSLKNTAEIISTTLPSENNYIFSPQYQRGVFFRNRGGQSGIGISAQTNTSHAHFQTANIWLSGNPFVFRDDNGNIYKDSNHLDNRVTERASYDNEESREGIWKLDKVYSYDNTTGELSSNKISWTISEYLSASTDNAKDQLLALNGLNNNNFGIVTLLARAGIPLSQAIYFVNQPILREYYKALDGLESIEVDFSKNKRNRIIDDLLSKYYGEKTNLAEFSLEKFPDKIGFTTEHLLNMLMSGASGAASQQSQAHILREFLDYTDISKAILAFQTTLSLDTNGLDKSIAENNDTADKISERYSPDYQNKTPLRNTERLEHDIISGVTLRLPQIVQQTTGRTSKGKWVTTYDSNSYSAVLSQIKQIGKFGELNATNLNHIQNHIRMFVVNGLFKNTLENRRNLLKDFPNKVDNIKRRYGGQLEFREFLSALSIGRSKLDGLRTVNILNSTNEDSNFQDKIANQWERMVRFGTEEQQSFAKDLILYAFLVSPQEYGTSNLVKYLTPQVLKDIGYNKFINSLEFNDSELLAPFVNQFFQHNPEWLQTVKEGNFIENSAESRDVEFTTKYGKVKQAKLIDSFVLPDPNTTEDFSLKSIAQTIEGEEGLEYPLMLQMYQNEDSGRYIYMRTDDSEDGTKYVRVDNLGSKNIYEYSFFSNGFGQSVLRANQSIFSPKGTIVKTSPTDNSIFGPETPQPILPSIDAIVERTSGIRSVEEAMFNELAQVVSRVINPEVTIVKSDKPFLAEWDPSNKGLISMGQALQQGNLSIYKNLLHESIHSILNEALETDNPKAKKVIETWEEYKKQIQSISEESVVMGINKSHLDAELFKVLYDTFGESGNRLLYDLVQDKKLNPKDQTKLLAEIEKAFPSTKWTDFRHTNIKEYLSGEFLNNITEIKNKYYAYANVKEFVAMSMTEPSFQGFLKTLKGHDKETGLLQSIWSKFIEAINKILGIEPGTLLYDSINRIVDLANDIKVVNNVQQEEQSERRVVVLPEFKSTKTQEDLDFEKSLDMSLEEIKAQLEQSSTSVKKGISELFNSNPELANEVYSIMGLNTINESEITYTDEEGNPCAKVGLTNTTKGTNWKIVKDFKGKPKHNQGGVDITISDKGVSMRRGGKDIKAKFGLLIPNNN